MRGLDGVLVLGCHFGDCHYISGNYRCRDRMEVIKELLNIVGIDPQRLHVGWVSAAEGQQFAQTVASFTDQLTAIGPLGEGDGEMRENLVAAIGALSSDRVRWLIGERETLVESPAGNVYGDRMSPEQYQQLLLESLADEYKCSKVVQAIAQGFEPLSAREIGNRTRLAPREVLPYINLLKDSGRVVLADIVDRSPRYRVISDQ